MKLNKKIGKIIDTYKHLKLINILLIILGAAIVSFGMYNIHDVADISEGGILGIDLLIGHWFGINPGITNTILTIICFLIGYKVMGKEFLAYSSVSVVAYFGFYMILQYANVPLVYPDIADYPLAAAIIGAIFVGVGVGITVKAGAAMSGDDAIAMAINHRIGVKISIVYLISDLTVLFLSLTYIPLTKIIYSVLTVTLSGQIIELIVHVNKRNKS